MGAVKYFRKFLLYTVIVLMSFSSLLNVNASFKDQNERIASEDLERYVVVDDPFERSFFGGIIQRAKIRVNQWFNGEGTIYENTTLDSIVINGQRLLISEILNNPNKLKELIASRDEEIGLEAIEVTNDTQDKYDYKEYLDLLIKNAQPMQIVFDTTWKKESGPYYILGEVQVMKGATLTIEPGTEVYFRSLPTTKHRSGILVDGELILEGTESEQIKLAPYGTDATSGSWKGIYVTERGSLNAEHSVIEKAGALTESAIYSYGPVTLDNVEIHQTKGSAITAFSDAIITNSLFKDNEKYGIDLYRYNKSFDTVVRSNNLEGNEIAGRITIRQTKIPDYDVSDNTATSTDLNGFVLGGDIIGNMSFTHPGENVPYVLTNTPDVYGEMKPFTIYPRSEVDFIDTVIKVVATPKFAPEHGMVINGTLNLNNSTITSLRDNTVASTTDKTDGVDPSNRDWSGLVVGESGTLNINQSTIKYANEAVYTNGSIHLNEATIKNVFSGIQGDGKFVIHDSTFTNLEAPAFEYYAGKEALDISVRNSTFTNINDVLGKVQVYQSGGELDLVNLTANQVKKHGVELTGSFNLDTTISQPGTNLPYLIPQLVINKSAKIDVTGDTILKVEDGLLMGYKAGIDVYGQLDLNGTSSNRVTITSLRDDTIGGDSNGDGNLTKESAGDWGSINYHSSSKNRDSQITYSDIKYGGDQYQGYALGGEGKFNIQHSTVTDSSEAGIGVLGTITIENSSLERNHGYGVHVHSNDNFSVVMNDNHFKDNLDYAAFVEFGSTLDHIEVSGNTTYNNFINGVGITGTVRYDLSLSPAGNEFPYVVPNTLVIEEGNSLTLNPKTVVKFQQQGQLDVYGNLALNGTSTNKVHLTSVKDDTIYGDTNNDGSQSIPQNGDWKSVNLYPNSKNNQKIEVTHSVISCGGNQEKDYMIGGEGDLIVKNSEIKNSSTNGLTTFSELVLTDSIIKDNSKNGVYISGNTLTDISLEKNKFNNNVESAALMNFITPNDMVSGNGNSATNNGINGISITGNIDEHNTFVKLGDEFPYVVDDTFTINPNYSLSLSTGVTIKFAEYARFEVEGHLKVNGTDENKVYFTSLSDDNIAGDTNNDENSEILDENWKGIVYHAESEGTFENFECKYSDLNMDYSKIPYLRAVSKADNKVSISGTKAAYIKLVEGKDKIYTYDFSTRTENLIQENDSIKSSVTLSDDTIAWVENDNENNSKVVVRSSKVDDQNYDGDYVYLGDNRIVVRDYTSIYYGSVGDANLTSKDSTHRYFEPVISSDYLFYKDENDQLYKLDLDSKESYYVISENNIHREVALYKDNIAMVSSQSEEGNPQIYVNKIDNWNTIQTTFDTRNTISHVSLLGDKLLYYRTGINLDGITKELIVQNPVDNKISTALIAKGYSVEDAQIGDSCLAFSDYQLIYLVKTSISSNDTSFVKTDNEHPGYEMNTYLGKGSSFSFGISAEDIPVGKTPLEADAGITIGTSEHEGVKYILHKNISNEYQYVGLERESSRESSKGGEFGLSVGIENLLEIGGSVGAKYSSTTLRSDRYKFIYDAQTYRSLGVLNTLLLLGDYLEEEGFDLYDIIARKLSMLIIDKERIAEFETETGKGFNADLSGQAGIGTEVSKGPLGFSGTLGVEANLSNSNMVKVGIGKDEDGEYKYASYYSSLSGNYRSGVLEAEFDVDLDLDVDLTPDLCMDMNFTGSSMDECDDSINIFNGISSTWSDSFLYDDIEYATTVSSPTVREDGTLLIPITTTFPNSGGYTTTTIYKLKLKNALDLDPTLFSGIEELRRAIEALDSSDPKDLEFNDEDLLTGYIPDLLKYTHLGGEVEFETYVHKYTDEYSLGFSFIAEAEGEEEEEEEEKIPKLSATATGGISINASAIDEFNVLIAKGNTNTSSMKEKYTAYIPVENEDVKRNMALIATATASVIEPINLKYTEGQLTLEHFLTNIRIEAPSFTNSHQSTFITAPVSLDSKPMKLPNEGQYLINESVYFNAYFKMSDNLNLPVYSYPEDSIIKFYIKGWKDSLKNNYAIFKYDTASRSWIKLGGKIDSSEKSISIELNEPGQYAVGYDENEPKIVFRNNDEELNTSNSNNLTVGDFINIEIIDYDSPFSEFIINGKEDIYYPNIPYVVDGEIGETYTLNVSYKDKFGNEFSKSINYTIVEPVVSVIEEENSIIKDEVLQENLEDSNSITDNLNQNETELNTEENSSDEVTTNQDESLILQESDKESSNMVNDLNQNETELNTEKDSSDEVTINSDEDFIESE